MKNNFTIKFGLELKYDVRKNWNKRSIIFIYYKMNYYIQMYIRFHLKDGTNMTSDIYFYIMIIRSQIFHANIFPL